MEKFGEYDKLFFCHAPIPVGSEIVSILMSLRSSSDGTKCSCYGYSIVAMVTNL